MIRSAGRALRIIFGVAFLVGAGLGLAFWARGSAFGGGELRRALTGRGRVAIFGGSALLALRPDGSTLVTGSSLPQLEQALLGQSLDALLAALDREHIDALFVEPHAATGPSLMTQLASYRHVGGLRGLYLAKDAALYGRDSVQ